MMNLSDLEDVMCRAPWLGHGGVMPFRPASPDEHARWAEEARHALADALDEVRTACAYLLARPEGRTWRDSYGLKHEAERWGRAVGMNSYVANGTLIAAAIHLDLPVRHVVGGPNVMVYFGQSHPVPTLRRVWSMLGARQDVAELDLTA
jgi:hypothetical protein